ncbi:TspO/MBR family protein [Rhodovulum sp. DZ06]|uniref:TspO/MBR family protein n=1 Tax=Rhodovulum sp. DZ06 TaxID=3425126 RepID=UPI003D334642
MDQLPFYIGPFGACAAAAMTGSLFRPGAWYAGLQKPSWTPPNWLFPVAWTLLYVLMALGAGRVAAALAAGQEDAWRGALGLGLWALQITLNALWSPVFFGLRLPRLGLGIICAMWIALAGTVWGFAGIDPLAALMVAPTLLWGAYAATLNLGVMRLNPASAFGGGAPENTAE